MPPQQRRRRRTTDIQQRPTHTQTTRTASVPTRSSRRERVVEKVDYTQDYDSVRRDIKRIAFLSIVLFLGMFAWYFIA